MGYKVSPTPSIEAEGGIETHINRFFEKRGSKWRFPDVLRVKNMRIGKYRTTKSDAADELGVSRNTIDKWWKKIDAKS